MPLGSSKFQNKNVQLGNGPGIPINTAVTLTLTYSGATGINIANNTVLVDLDSEFANVVMDYEITGNIATGDFADATLTGNVTTDANGNASLSKTIVSTTGNGHKDFVIKFIRPGSNVEIVSTPSQYIYEMLPIQATGGDSVVEANADGLTHKIHKFTTPGNANISITNTMGNYTGNTNIWHEYFQISNDDSFFRSDKIGLKFRSLISGGAPNRANVTFAGAGEMGVLEYEFTDLANIEYVMSVGDNWYGSGNNSQGNSTIFANSPSIKRTALAGGTTTYGYGSGGSGGAGANAAITLAETDLAENYANVAQPGNFKQYVTFASGSNGSIGGNAFTIGGGGAFGTGGNLGVGTTVNGYGFSVAEGGGWFGGAQGGNGVYWAPNGSTGPYGIDYTNWYYNPLYGDSTYVGVDTGTGFAGGGGTTNRAYVDNRGPSQQFLIVINGNGDVGGGAKGQLNPGGAGTEWAMTNASGTHEFGPYNTSADASDAYSNGPRYIKQEPGIVTLSYPYANTRFITGTVIT